MVSIVEQAPRRLLGRRSADRLTRLRPPIRVVAMSLGSPASSMDSIRGRSSAKKLAHPSATNCPERLAPRWVSASPVAVGEVRRGNARHHGEGRASPRSCHRRFVNRMSRLRKSVCMDRSSPRSGAGYAPERRRPSGGPGAKVIRDIPTPLRARLLLVILASMVGLLSACASRDGLVGSGFRMCGACVR